MDIVSEIVNIRSRIKGRHPRYSAISCELRELIRSNRLGLNTRLPGIYALAKLLNVNYRTIRAALEILEKEGLVACNSNRPAIICGQKTPTTLKTAFIRWRGDAFGVAMFDGIKQFSDENNVELQIIDAAASHDRYLDAIEHSVPDISGLILHPHECPGYAEKVQKAIDAGLKIVFVDRMLPEVAVSLVTADHFAGAYRAATHLLDSHPLPVYYLGLAVSPSSCRQRFEGWVAAMREHSFMSSGSYFLNITPAAIGDAADSTTVEKDAFNVVHTLLSSHRAEAYSIFAENDYFALQVYHAAEKCGLVVGKNVFIVGVDNLPFCAKLDIPLSSVEQFTHEVGYQAAKTLHEHLTGTLARPTNRVISTTLHIRASSR